MQTINLKKLQQCGSCYTRVKVPGLCSYCLGLEKKWEVLVNTAKNVLYAPNLIIERKIPTKPEYECDICGCKPNGKRGTNYLIFGDKTYCKNCKRDGKV